MSTTAAPVVPPERGVTGAAAAVSVPGLMVRTFLLAFCSVVYELLLGQTLSSFLGNTVLRYSVTIGLYMLSMGIGAMLTRGPLLRRPVLWLQRMEIGLTTLGALCVPLLFMVDAWTGSQTAVSVVGHGSIIAIGILTGTEIPLLIRLRGGELDDGETGVLGIDYLGAFLGTICFAFWFYPHVSLIPTALTIALLNAAVGVSLCAYTSRVDEDDRPRHGTLLLVQVVLLVATLAALLNSDAIHDFCLQHYLGA